MAAAVSMLTGVWAFVRVFCYRFVEVEARVLEFKRVLLLTYLRSISRFIMIDAANVAFELLLLSHIFALFTSALACVSSRDNNVLC